MKQEKNAMRAPKDQICGLAPAPNAAQTALLVCQIQHHLDQITQLMALLPTDSLPTDWLASRPTDAWNTRPLDACSSLSVTTRSAAARPRRTTPCGWLAYGHRLVENYRKGGRWSAAEKLRTSLQSFARFLPTDDVPLQQLDASLMQQYDQYLKVQGLTPNTRSFYLRTLRAAYNTAVQQGLTPQHSPFQHTFTGISKTQKRALPLDDLVRFKKVDWKEHSKYAQTQALFLLSFYLRGISFIDLAYLRKTDLQNGFVRYRRHKTGQLLTIRWEPCMQQQLQLLWKLSGKDETCSPLLLPVLGMEPVPDRVADPGLKTSLKHASSASASSPSTHTPELSEETLRRQYINASHLFNKRLRSMGQQLGLSLPLTSYVARHTWASVAKQRNVPLHVISESLGHDNQRTTQIYLSQLEQDVLDAANRKVCERL